MTGWQHSKLGIEQTSFETLRQTIADTQGDLVIMFGGELSAEAQAVIAQLPHSLRTRRAARSAASAAALQQQRRRSRHGHDERRA